MNQENRHGYALIVGISKYQDVRIRRLACTVNDAQAIYDLLTNPDRAGFKKENVKVLLNEKATLKAIKDAISNWLFKNADEDSTVVIFFACHGGVEEDRFGREADHLAKYLLPYDTLFDNFSASALSNSDFNMFLQAIKSKRLIVFMDSCYSGGVTEGARDVKITEDPYIKMAEGEGRLVIAASQPNQRSFEDRNLDHGIFTYHLLEALSGSADHDGDGIVTALEIYNYLAEKVPKTALKLSGGVQEPIMRGDVKKDFVLTTDLCKIRACREEEVREQNRRKLSEWYHEGKLSGAHYELACTLIEKDDLNLNSEERRIRRSLDDLLSDRISCSTFVYDCEMVKKLKEQTITNVNEMEFQNKDNTLKIEKKQTENLNEKILRQDLIVSSINSNSLIYVGFGRRFAALIIDSIPLTIVNLFLAFVFGDSDELYLISSLFINFLYYAGLESSSDQGTLGKQALGIKVTDIEGNRISFGKAAIRYITKVFTFGIGYITIIFSKKKQGLYDMAAGTVVVYK